MYPPIEQHAIHKKIPSQTLPQPKRSTFLHDQSSKCRYRKFWYDAETGKNFFIQSDPFDNPANDYQDDNERDKLPPTPPPPSKKKKPVLEPEEHSEIEQSLPEEVMQIIKAYRPPRLQPENENLPESDYHTPTSNIQMFHNEFPLPPALYKKWKNCVRLYYSASHSRSKQLKMQRQTQPTEYEHKIIHSLLENNIIRPAKKSKYISTFFLPGKAPRPIVNFKHLSKYIKTPKFKLPSLYQRIARNPWPKMLYYIKIDFKHTFFNINLHEKAKYVQVRQQILRIQQDAIWS